MTDKGRKSKLGHEFRGGIHAKVNLLMSLALELHNSLTCLDLSRHSARVAESDNVKGMPDASRIAGARASRPTIPLPSQMLNTTSQSD